MYLQIDRWRDDMLARLQAKFAKIRYNVGIIWDANTNPIHRKTPYRYLSARWEKNKQMLEEQARNQGQQ